MKKRSDNLLNVGILFLITSMIIAFLNYLYHLFMGRMLGAEQYGILASLFALIYIFTFCAGTFQLTISKFSSEFQSKNQLNLLSQLFKKATKKTCLYGSLAVLAYFILTPVLANFLKLNISGLILVGIIGFISLISSIFIGTLNGMQKFTSQNLASFVSAFLKFSLAVFFVFLGLGVNGALFAILMGILASLLIAYLPINKELKNAKYTKSEKENFEVKRIYKFMIPVFLYSLIFVLFITLDQILVKHYFSSLDAGLYAAASNIAKIIWFSSSFLIMPIFPKVVGLASKNKSSTFLLRKSLLYTLAIIILGCLFYLLFPEFVVLILYGKPYSSISSLILIFGISMGLYSLIQLFSVYNLALEKYNFIYILLLSLIIEIIGIILFHGSLVEIVNVFFIVNVFTLLLMLFYNYKELFK